MSGSAVSSIRPRCGHARAPGFAHGCRWTPAYWSCNSGSSLSTRGLRRDGCTCLEAAGAANATKRGQQAPSVGNSEIVERTPSYNSCDVSFSTPWNRLSAVIDLHLLNQCVLAERHWYECLDQFGNHLFTFHMSALTCGGLLQRSQRATRLQCYSATYCCTRPLACLHSDRSPESYHLFSIAVNGSFALPEISHHWRVASPNYPFYLVADKFLERCRAIARWCSNAW